MLLATCSLRLAPAPAAAARPSARRATVIRAGVVDPRGSFDEADGSAIVSGEWAPTGWDLPPRREPVAARVAQPHADESEFFDANGVLGGEWDNRSLSFASIDDVNFYTANHSARKSQDHS